MGVRLDKFLSEMGAGTRSTVKQFIKKGMVTIDGSIVTTPDYKVEPDSQIVTLDGEEIRYVQYEYFLFYKPKDCVSATVDNCHKTVLDYITDNRRNDLFPVGRLDIDTEGLLLITNDGALSHRLLSPKKHVEKTYYAKVDGRVTEEDVALFREGVDIGEDSLTMPARLEILTSGDISEVHLTICEGKFHQVKRMFEAVDKEVIYLKRISMGPLTLDETLHPGEYRPLTNEELKALEKAPC